MNSFDFVTTISLISSVASLILAVLAIWLSVVFYRLSTKVSESANKAANDIQSSVERLQQIFDRLYSDTFSIMRDTVSDMRRHIWPGEKTATQAETEAKTEERLDELKTKIETQLTTILEKQGATDSKIEADDVKHLITQAINESTKIAAEVQQENLMKDLREAVSRYASQEGESFATSSTLIRRIQGDYPVHGLVEILKGLRDLKSEGLLDWRGDELTPATTVRIVGKG